MRSKEQSSGKNETQGAAVSVDRRARLLAWNVAGTIHPGVMAQLLLDASKSGTSGKPMLLVDGGVENFNVSVDEPVETGLLKRVLAQTEVTFSNALIESWCECSSIHGCT